MYLGIDIGTSSVKAVVMDDDDRSGGRRPARRSPSPIRGRCGRSRTPQDWWQASSTALDALAGQAPAAMAAVRGIGLSGQMLGVTLLDAADTPIRPALLWNDGRASAECADLASTRRRISPISSAAAPCRASRRPNCCGWRGTSPTPWRAPGASC